MSGIRRRLKALEGVRHCAPEGEGRSEQMAQIAACERQACLILAWVRHNKNGEPIGNVLPEMLGYVAESEAMSLLAMDYKSVYRAIGMPHHEAVKLVHEAKPDERVLPKIRVPGRVAR